MADTSTSDTRGLTPGSGYTSGYLTPARSSSPGSGSFHTANPIDSERSSLTGQDSVDDGEDWEREKQDNLSSVEIPSLGAPQISSHLRDDSGSESDDDTDITLRNNSDSPPVATVTGLNDGGRGGGGEASRNKSERGRNWLHQPKLEAVESENVLPCPQKRPLHHGLEAPIPSRMQEPTNVRENTPLLPPASSSSQSRDTGCCIML